MVLTTQVPTLEEEAEAIAAEADGTRPMRQPADWDPDSCWLMQLLYGPDGPPPGVTLH